MVDLPIRIREKRESKGYNKSKLGAILGISGTAIAQYENGKNMPKVEVLLKLSKVLKWDFINDKPLENSDFNQSNDIVTNFKATSKPTVNNAEVMGFNDVEKPYMGYDENSTEIRKQAEGKRGNILPDYFNLYRNQRDQLKLSRDEIKLLREEIDILNNLLQL